MWGTLRLTSALVIVLYFLMRPEPQLTLDPPSDSFRASHRILNPRGSQGAAMRWASICEGGAVKDSWRAPRQDGERVHLTDKNKIPGIC